MSTLTHRLFHIIRSTLGQFLGMAAVIAVGISLYISFTTALFNLQESQHNFYTQNNFADHYFYVVRAPEPIIKQVQAVAGVAKATGRIQKDVSVIKPNGERATARLTSYPLPQDNEVNQVQLLAGRYFEKYAPNGGFEALVDPGFFSANQLEFGTSIDIIAENTIHPLTVVGTATGPEFTYPIKDASTLMPDYETFGIVMVPHNQSQQIFNLPGQINQVLIQFTPGIAPEKAVEEIKQILQPYGVLADFPRKDQLSHLSLQAEMDGLDTMAGFLPVLFLGIAAAIQFILLRRMIKSQRTQIGILKALGYSNRHIILHFSSYAVMVGLLGALAGIMLGVAFAAYFSKMYAMFFNLPSAIGGINIRVIVNSIVLSLLVSFFAGLSASRSVVSILPAESMRPVPPVSSNRSLLEMMPLFWQRLNSSWKMALRTISRNRLRYLISVFGIASAVSLLVVSMVINDSVDYMMNQHFAEETSYDYLLQFSQPLKEDELSSIQRIDGIQKTEGFLTIPVKMYLHDKNSDDVLQGQDFSSTLKFPAAQNGETLPIPAEGIVISQHSAKELGAEVGDTIKVETLMGSGQTHYADLKIVGINHQLFGVESYISLDNANRILQESSLVTGAMLKINQNKAGEIEEQLADMTGITSILSKQKEKDNIFSMMDSMVYMIGIMTFFATILGFVIVFNSVIMSFNERKRELTSLLTIGYTRSEVANLLLKETIPQALPGILLGLPAGRCLAYLYFHSVEYDMWIIPLVVYPDSYVWAVLGGLVFVLLGQWFAGRGIKSLDTVELLKNID